MPYQPIEDYGVVGDLHTVALVGLNGSIDWMCYPHFDSPSIFAAILDDEKGGRFQIAPIRDDVNRKQMYFPDTNVLLTRFLSPDGVAEVTDFMPVGEAVALFWPAIIGMTARSTGSSVTPAKCRLPLGARVAM